jgi:hypothetical protein
VKLFVHPTQASSAREIYERMAVLQPDVVKIATSDSALITITIMPWVEKIEDSIGGGPSSVAGADQ